jgi:hypothetical protein
MMKVNELLESMRANPSVLVEYTNAGALINCSTTVTCSTLQRAQDDVYWWKQNIKAGLPFATTTSVTLSPAIAPSRMATVNVTVSWKERNKGGAGSVNKSYTTTANICTQIPC